MIDFVKLVEQMRQAQSQYFKEKSQSNLSNAKALESKVDKACRSFKEKHAAQFQIFKNQD
jgi:hypothetical protein